MMTVGSFGDYSSTLYFYLQAYSSSLFVIILTVKAQPHRLMTIGVIAACYLLFSTVYQPLTFVASAVLYKVYTLEEEQ